MAVLNFSFPYSGVFFFFFFLHNMLNKLIFFCFVLFVEPVCLCSSPKFWWRRSSHSVVLARVAFLLFIYFNWTWRFKALLLLNRKYFLFCLCLIVNSICFHIQEKCCLYKIHTTVCTTLFCVYLFYAYHLMLHSLHWKGARGFFWVLCIDIF